MDNRFVLDFLRDLSQNNNRTWFNENKDRYQYALEQYTDLLSQFIVGCSLFDSSITYITPSEAMYRIYRDVRFSPDKRPYKNHFGAYVAPHGGHKSVYAGYYLHLEPSASMVCGGIGWLDAPLLKRVRKHIDLYHDTFLELISDPDFVSHFGQLQAMSTLKRVPTGFSADSPVAEYLKMKDFFAEQSFTDKEVCADSFLEKALATARATHRFNSFMNKALDE